MGYIDYTKEPVSDIAFIDMKSFYASVECVDRGLHPLRTSLCVMSQADNSSGLILASSPIFKKVFGKQNVSRSYDLPFDVKTRKFNYKNAWKLDHPITDSYIQAIEFWARHTLIVPPRMDRYIEKNLDIQNIFLNYAAHEDILPYSIDESFVDLSSSLNYFVKDKTLSKKEKLDLISARIQKDIYKETGIFSTIGQSNANPLLAKLALDNEAKKTKTMRANWSYEDVENKVWNIEKMTDFWGIGSRTEIRLQKLGIHSIYDLAHANPECLKKEFGVRGLQLWFHANGVDESNVHIPYQPKSNSLGNSQILPRDYTSQEEVETILREMAEQVAIRLRKHKKKTRCVGIAIGFSRTEMKRGIHAHKKIYPTSQTKELIKHVIALFRSKYSSGSVRQIGVFYSELTSETYEYISLFDDYQDVKKEEKLECAIDSIREKYGFLSVQNATVLTDASRNIQRSKRIGGHSAGGLEGLQ